MLEPLVIAILAAGLVTLAGMVLRSQRALHDAHGARENRLLQALERQNHTVFRLARLAKARDVREASLAEIAEEPSTPTPRAMPDEVQAMMEQAQLESSFTDLLKQDKVEPIPVPEEPPPPEWRIPGYKPPGGEA